MTNKNIILLSSSRSGTNFLLDIAARNFPEYLVLREIFREKSDSFSLITGVTGLDRAEIADLAARNPLDLWQRLEAGCAAHNRNVMAKIFYYHQPEDSPLWSWFRDQNRVLHLIRANFFDSWVSRKLMERTGHAISRKNRPQGTEPQDTEPAQFIADPEEAEQFIQARQAYVTRFRAFFAGADFKELFYEDISGSSAECLAAVSGVLGMQPKINTVRETVLQRQKKRTNAEIIENYDEVAHLDRRYYPPAGPAPAAFVSQAGDI